MSGRTNELRTQLRRRQVAKTVIAGLFALVLLIIGERGKQSARRQIGRDQDQPVREHGRLGAAHQSQLANRAFQHNNRGNVLAGQGKLDAAIADYGQAIAIQIRLVEREGRGELANYLAMSHINRGICLRRKRDVHAALRDFEQGVEIYTRLVDIDGRGELSPELARSHRHRGMARRNQGYAQGAMADLEKAIELLTRLVERENHRELAPELAKFLSETAWIYATSLDRSFRNGKKAHRFALQACELTEWKALFPVRALAAAHAETGNFAEAIKWQEKAVDLAPENNRGTLRSTLELFRAGQPLREPAAQDSAHP